MGIMALVWMNMPSNTTTSQAIDGAGTNRPKANKVAAPAHTRSRRTRSPVWSLSQPQP